MCGLLPTAEVRELMGGGTLIKSDEVDTNDSRRGCLWQFTDTGDLYLDVSLTSPADFSDAKADGTEVPGVGDDAYRRADHLNARYGEYAVDTYVHQDVDDDALLARETRIADRTAAALHR